MPTCTLLNFTLSGPWGGFGEVGGGTGQWAESVRTDFNYQKLLDINGKAMKSGDVSPNLIKTTTKTQHLDS